LELLQVRKYILFLLANILQMKKRFLKTDRFVQYFVEICVLLIKKENLQLVD
jgi:hypothetical protein